MAAAAAGGTELRHYEHDPTHPLIELDDSESNPQQEFFCGGCKSSGRGKRLHCEQCEFSLHSFCATCPLELSTFSHPEHPLRLLMSPPSTLPPGVGYICSICDDHINGAHYLCTPCDFGFHPYCSLIPHYVNNADLDPNHPLELQPPIPGRSCNVCKNACDQDYWWYRCMSCDLDAHYWCLGDQVPNPGPPAHVSGSEGQQFESLEEADIYYRSVLEGIDNAAYYISGGEYRYVYERRDDWYY